MIFEFAVTQIGRQDDEFGKIKMEGKSRTIYGLSAFVYVPFDELGNYKIGDKFVLLPEGTPIEKV